MIFTKSKIKNFLKKLSKTKVKYKKLSDIFRVFKQYRKLYYKFSKKLAKFNYNKKQIFKIFHYKKDLFDVLKFKTYSVIKIYDKLFKNKNKIDFENNYLVNKYNIFLFKESLRYLYKTNKYVFIKYNFIKSLHYFTGFNNIYIKFQSILKSNLKLLDIKYNKLYEYNHITLKINRKYLLVLKKLQKFINVKFQEWNLFYKSFELKFTWYELKVYLNFFKKLYYYISLSFFDSIINFKFISNLFFEVFKYFYKKKEGYFKKAFKFFNKVIYTLFKSEYLPLSGFKVIAKGRFGKKRKQKGRIQLGFLKLHTVGQIVCYSNNLLMTKRGSYGFHIWSSFDNYEIFKDSKKKHAYYRL